MAKTKTDESVKAAQSQMTDRDVFRQLVAEHYTPTTNGSQIPSEDAMYRTSRELQYEFRNSCEPSLADISSVMMELKFQGKPLAGTGFAWILYEKFAEHFDPS